MNASTSNCLSSEQLSRIWTAYSPTTIRELAQKGRLPVMCWFGPEPIFARDPETIRALQRLEHGSTESIG